MMEYVDASLGALGTIRGARESGSVVGMRDGYLLVHWLGSDCPWPARVPLESVRRVRESGPDSVWVLVGTR